jgi:hypothetical protein
MIQPCRLAGRHEQSRALKQAGGMPIHHCVQPALDGSLPHGRGSVACSGTPQVFHEQSGIIACKRNPEHLRIGSYPGFAGPCKQGCCGAFVRKLNVLESGRRHCLPGEAEWEYAGRGDSKADPYGPVEAIAWLKENSAGSTHPVGLKQPDILGLYVMSGNLSEWCQETWHPDCQEAATDGSAWEGPGRWHTLRGADGILRLFSIMPPFAVRTTPSIGWASVSRMLREPDPDRLETSNDIPSKTDPDAAQFMSES